MRFNFRSYSALGISAAVLASVAFNSGCSKKHGSLDPSSGGGPGAGGTNVSSFNFKGERPSGGDASAVNGAPNGAGAQNGSAQAGANGAQSGSAQNSNSAQPQGASVNGASVQQGQVGAGAVVAGVQNGSQSGTQAGAGNQNSANSAGAGGNARVAVGAGSLSVGGVGVPSVGGVVPGAGVATNGASAQGQTQQAQAPAQPPEPTSGCFVQTYHHKKMSSHSDDESCSQHKNLIKLPHPNVRANSICVRVNGRPVAFARNKKNSEELILGPVAGPNSTITARYCLGKTPCNENCVVPKDEFLTAIGGSLAGGEDAALGQWESEGEDKNEKGKVGAELKKELAEIEQMEAGTIDAMKVFKDWISETEAPGCQSKQADLGANRS